MYELLLRCLDKSILLKTKDEDVIDYFKNDYFVRETIPAYSTSQRGKHDGEIRYINSADNKTVFNKKDLSMEIRIARNKLYLPDVVYSAVDFFSRVHEESNRSMIHCSVISDRDENGIVFIGDAGSGKTSIALQLCLDNGFYFCSNDRTILEYRNGYATFLGGTREIDIRISSIKNHFTRFKSLSPKGSNDPWREKVILTQPILRDAGINFKSRATIKQFYFVWVHPFSGYFRNKELSYKEALERLFFFSSQYVRGNGRFITCLDRPIPSLDTLELSKKRLNSLREIMKSAAASELFGELSSLQRAVQKLHGG